MLAPLYVPIVFGAKWTVAIPVLMLICLSALPRPFAGAASQLVRAVGLPGADLRWNVLFTALLAGALFVGVHWGILGVAIAVLAVHVAAMPLFVVWASARVLGTPREATP
jgi:PST family polysaccharide transporter